MKDSIHQRNKYVIHVEENKSALVYALSVKEDGLKRCVKTTQHDLNGGIKLLKKTTEGNFSMEGSNAQFVDHLFLVK